MKRSFRFSPDPYFVVGLVAVVASGVAYRIQAAPAPAPLPASHVSSALVQRLDQLGAGRSFGEAGAPVRVVELFDYQCPACAAAHRANWPALAAAIQQGTVHYTAYDLPLPGHANAIPAAVVANCAADGQPEKFGALRDALFGRQAEWQQAYPAEPALLRVAAGAGADTAAVRECVSRTGAARAAVYRRTWEAASAEGVTFTPAWAVNGKVVRWAALQSEIAAAARSHPGGRS